MVILRGLQDSEGNIWRCRLKNLYLIEVNVSDTGLSSAKVGIRCCPACKMSGLLVNNTLFTHWSLQCNNSIDLIRLLPMTRCLSPCECLGGQCECRSIHRNACLTIFDSIDTFSPNYWWSCNNGWEGETQWTIPKGLPVSLPVPAQDFGRWVHILQYAFWRRWNWLHSVAAPVSGSH